ncbi:MAG: ATP-binding protein [Methyloligellaceae bacterium]
MSNRKRYAVDLNWNKRQHKAGSSFSTMLRHVPVNLRARRSLLIVIAAVIIFMTVWAEVPFVLASCGYAVIFAAAGFLPRKGMLRPLVSITKSPSLQKVETIECQSIIDVMPFPALMLNAHGKVLYMNEKSREIFSPGALHQHISSFIRDPDFLDAINQVPRRDAPIEIYYTERVPVERKMNVSIARFKGARHNIWIPSILVSFQDLTDQGRINQMRSDFIANVSHELRTPLASVMGFIDTLQGSARNDPSVQDKFFGIMRDQVERMTRLINDLLSLSKVEMDVHILPKDRVDLAEVVDYVVATLHPLADELKVDLQVESDLEVADIKGTRDEIIQLFQNLIHNALKYGASGSKVTVNLTKESDRVSGKDNISVAVIDRGPGIAVEHLPRLTERFYRVDVKSSRDKGGTGLGLAIVKHIITRHRGELKIKSKLGEGSVFKVLIPQYAE